MTPADENLPSNMTSSYDNLLDGVNLPAKDEVAAAIAAVRSRRGGLTSPGALASPGGVSTPGGRFGTFLGPPTTKSAGAPATTSSSLFQQSSAKLQSFSFGESTEETSNTNSLPSNNSNAARATAAAATSSGVYTLSPSMAQLRARKIINESKNRQAHNANKPLSPTFSDDDTDTSTVVDPSTIAQVGQFIDSLQKKKMSSNIPPPSPAAARYSSLDHAKNVMKQQLRIVTKFDNDDTANLHAWSPSAADNTTPQTRNLTNSAYFPTAASSPVPYLPDDDSDTSISIESSIESMTNDSFQDENDAQNKNNEGVIKPETEEELDSFIHSINNSNTAVEVNSPTVCAVEPLNVSTVADELNAMSAALVERPLVDDAERKKGDSPKDNNVSTSSAENKQESGSVDAADKNAVAAPNKFSFYNHDSTGAAESEQESGLAEKAADKNAVVAPTKFSFYTLQAFMSAADKPTDLEKEEPAATPVESKEVPIVEKLKTATTPSGLSGTKAATPFSPASQISASSQIIQNKQPATTPTARARMFLASSSSAGSKPKTPVSRVLPQSPASSINNISTTKAPLTPASKDGTSSANKSPSSQTIQDPTYEESLARITAQIQEVVRSKVPSMTLGKVLAEANRRGITLDVVTEIYKKERFKLSSEKIAQWEEAASGVKTTGASPSTPVESNAQPEMNPVKQPAMQSHKASENVTSVEIEPAQQPAAKTGRMPSTPVESNAHGEQANVEAEQMNPVKLTIRSPKASEAVTPVEIEPSRQPAAKTGAIPSTPVESNAQDKQIKPVEAPDSSSVKAMTALTVDTNEIPSTPKSPASKPSALERILSPRSTLDHFVVRIKQSVKSDNPSQELGNILADAKKHHIPVNPLVELYTKERMALPVVPKDIAVSQDVDLTQSNTEVSEVSDAVPESDSFEDGERGLSDTQLQQLQQLISRSGETEDAGDRSMEDIDDDVEKAAMQHLEDIDAFFSRFAIDGVDADSGKKAAKKSEDASECQADATKSTKDSDIRRKNNTVRFQTPSQEVIEDEYVDLEPQDSSQFSERGNIAEVTTTNGKETVLYVQESSLEVEFVEPIVQAAVPKKKKKKVKEKKQKVIKIRPRDNRRVVVLRDDLPGHLGYWRSPWEANRVRSHYYSANCKNDGIDGVAAAARFARRRGDPRQRHCFLSEKERTTGHKGYREIDFYSLYEATTVQAEDQEIDLAPWDCRDVRQRFLYEKSVESRNWFGTFIMSRGNDRLHYPVSRPKSLQMQVTRIPDEDEWNENWYTTWRSRRDNPNNLVAFAELEIKTMSSSEEDKNTIVEGLSSLDESIHEHGSKAPKRKVNIEIGTLCPVRLKTGERISRVHPEFTSSLRRSTWRKKYVSGMQFPAN